MTFTLHAYASLNQYCVFLVEVIFRLLLFLTPQASVLVHILSTIESCKTLFFLIPQKVVKAVSFNLSVLYEGGGPLNLSGDFYLGSLGRNAQIQKKSRVF